MSPNNPFLYPLLLLRSDIVTCACSHSATLSFSPGQHRVSVVCPAHGRCEQIATTAPFFWSKYLTCFGSCSEGIVPTSLPSSSPASGCLLVNQYLFEHVPSRMNSEGPDHGLSSAKDNKYGGTITSAALDMWSFQSIQRSYIPDCTHESETSKQATGLRSTGAL